MVHELDYEVGRLMKILQMLNIEDNTLLFFLNDNGSPPLYSDKSRPSSPHLSPNRPLRGYKGDLYEGGVRVPFLIQWPGVISSGQIVTVPVSSLDILPTILSLFQPSLLRSVSKIDLLQGRSIFPNLELNSTKHPRFVSDLKSRSLLHPSSPPPPRHMFWRFSMECRPEKRAMLRWPWKWLKIGTNASELYDMGSSDSEVMNVAEQHQDVVHEIEALHGQWESLLPPIHISGGGSVRPAVTCRGQERERDKHTV